MTKPEGWTIEPVKVPEEVPGAEPTAQTTAEISAMQQMDEARDWQEHKQNRCKATLLHWLWMGFMLMAALGAASVFVAWLCLLLAPVAGTRSAAGEQGRGRRGHEVHRYVHRVGNGVGGRDEGTTQEVSTPSSTE